MGITMKKNNVFELPSIKKISEQAARTILKALDAKDHYTFGHSMRVAYFSLVTGAEAGLTSKETWKAYKKTLLWNRCAAFGARRIAPDVLTGVYETTEMLDVENKTYKLSDEGDITILS